MEEFLIKIEMKNKRKMKIEQIENDKTQGIFCSLLKKDTKC